MISLPGSINLSVKANTCNCFGEPTISNNARVFPRGEDNESTLFQKFFFPTKIQEQNQRAKDTLAKYLTRKLDHPTAQTLISDLNENTKPLLVKDVNKLRTEAEQLKLAKLVKKFKEPKTPTLEAKFAAIFRSKRPPAIFVLKREPVLKRYRFSSERISSKLERTTNASPGQIAEITNEIIDVLIVKNTKEVDATLIQNLLVEKIIRKKITLKQPNHSISFDTIYPPFRK